MSGQPFRILAVNSNTDHRVTDRVTRAIGDVLPGCHVEGITAGFGPRGIGGRADLTISAMATLSAAVDHEGEHDAIIVACFSDPGLSALREVLDIPVVGIGEASFLTAVQLGARFCVVTVGPRVVPIIEEAVHATGLTSRFAGVEIVDSAALQAPDPVPLLLQGVEKAVRDRGAEVAILGGAAFAGLAAQVSAQSPIPIVGSVEAAAAQAMALLQLKACRPRVGSYARPAAKPMTGLSGRLALLLASEAS
jgi:Asp/Glu/hydantoin racemase